MTAKLYSKIDGVRPAKPLGPQARIVWDALSSTPKLATDLNVVTGPQFKTRQDSLRVTLYYVLVFKKAGMVAAHEPTGDAPVENAFAGLVGE